MMSRPGIMAGLLMTLLCPGIVHADHTSQLPDEPTTPVIEMWYLREGIPSHPEVIILSDGRMQVMSPEGPQRSDLTADALQQLLENLLHRDGLATVNSAELRREIAEQSHVSGLSSTIQGAGETVIRLRTRNSAREIRCPAVGILAVRFPQIQGIQAIAAAQRRLENLRAVTTVGGPEEARSIAQLAARAVEDEYGVTLPVTCEDLSMVRALPDGSRFCQFLVANQNDELHMISLVEAPGLHPRVSMIGGTPLVR